jgi:hypothetical protein
MGAGPISAFARTPYVIFAAPHEAHRAKQLATPAAAFLDVNAAIFKQPPA